MKKFSFSHIKKIHFIGIKGVAMSGLAVICKERGLEVRGSDVDKVFITDKVLEEKQIVVFKNFSPGNLSWNPELVVMGASWDESHPEYIEAKKRKISVMRESELRGEFSRQKTTIAVTGVHGKSTTTSLLAYIFTLAGLKPSYLVGTAFIPDLGVNGHWDEGKYFIVEGDEYAKSKTDRSPKFLDLSPDTAIITTLEWEHVDIYPNIESMEDVFRTLVEKTKNTLIACQDSPSIQKIIEGHKEKVVTYGYSMDSDWQVADFSQKLYFSKFTVKKRHKIFDDFEVNLMGRFNALNSLACTIAALHYGIEKDVIKKALKTFSGLERRMNISTWREFIFIDDYGHHPTEVKETLHAIRGTYGKRNIICVFQPHMVSRTMAFLDEFGKSFLDTDMVVLLDIFASERERGIPFQTKDLFEEIQKHHRNAKYFGGLKETAAELKKIIRPRDVIVTMGAGDVYKIKELLIENLKG